MSARSTSATNMMTVVTIPMRDKIVRSVVLHSSSVKMINVSTKNTCVMEIMIVGIIPMNTRTANVPRLLALVTVKTRHV